MPAAKYLEAAPAPSRRRRRDALGSRIDADVTPESGEIHRGSLACFARSARIPRLLFLIHSGKKARGQVRTPVRRLPKPSQTTRKGLQGSWPRCGVKTMGAQHGHGHGRERQGAETRKRVWPGLFLRGVAIIVVLVVSALFLLLFLLWYMVFTGHHIIPGAVQALFPLHTHHHPHHTSFNQPVNQSINCLAPPCSWFPGAVCNLGSMLLLTSPGTASLGSARSCMA